MVFAPTVRLQTKDEDLRGLCWFRRDLRLDDHAALFHALTSTRSVHCVFVFDTDILQHLPSPQDRRVEFIWYAVQELAHRLSVAGGGLWVLHGSAREEIPRLARRLKAHCVFCNRDEDPVARERDAEISARLQSDNIQFLAFKDQVIFESDEILNQQGQAYRVFTPYKRAWMEQLRHTGVLHFDITPHLSALAKISCPAMPALDALGFEPTNLRQMNLPLGIAGAEILWHDFLQRIDRYHETRDYPGRTGASYLSAHIRFGTISLRRLVGHVWQRGSEGAQTWLGELIWRDFYHMILGHRPDLAEGASFKTEYDRLTFPGRDELFDAWCSGRTGYPLVDAAMRQINQTGYMHNRLRMITASFLTKNLQIDWRKGEAYFAQHLLDFDRAANNGGWQWSASTGCDAQPWFRLFNPVTQSERFDPQGKFIRRYLPELANCPDRWLHAPWRMPAEELAGSLSLYWPPIVDHAVSRQQTLARFKAITSQVYAPPDEV